MYKGQYHLSTGTAEGTESPATLLDVGAVDCNMTECCVFLNGLPVWCVLSVTHIV
jgi:hypothetical protein